MKTILNSYLPLSVRYNDSFAILIRAIQEQQAMIERLLNNQDGGDENNSAVVR